MGAYIAALAFVLRSVKSRLGPLPESSNLSQSRNEPQRTLWSVACLLTWIHVLCAFGFRHHWSHAEAYAHTASETERMIGVDWGGGIYFNYLFLALWTIDALWWWRAPASYRARSRAVSLSVHIYLAFIVFNATVVFGPAPVRYTTLAAIAVLMAMVVIRLR